MKKIIKKILIILVLIITPISLAGCKSYGTKQGVIIDKQYSPKHTTFTYMTRNIGGIVTTTPIPIHHSESYKMKIQKKEDGKTKEIWIDVTQQEYEQHEIGDYYNQKENI